ncbi:uncharacterized protein LOC113543651 [Pangasianodon hypophthalmus]|uniref:uncharacterized protein LOC113543651 n=1 Tax=Pangasianodon hypophthalmus TaxID=310915 RepID=UPI0023071534|nr:uncharacterized protein LOC113543651 [Pangasianodon hypophthalmus]
MASLRSYSFICSVWMHLSFLSAMKRKNCSVFNQTEIIYQGNSTTINCHYSKNRSERFTVSLKRNHSLCEYMYFNKSWTEQSCKDNIRFLWIPETEEISFQLLNLQINNSGMYTCTVVNYLPPPSKCLGEKRIFIHVKSSPSVNVSCVKGPDGAPRVLCTSEGFYPPDQKQAWLRDGEYISYQNTSLRPLYENLNFSDGDDSKYTDGSYIVKSYLHLSSNISVYYCWVNHSTLSQPITVNISSTECTERKETLTGGVLSVTGISCGILASIGLILAGCYQCLRRRTYLQSPVDAPPLYEPVSHSTLGTLGNHWPVPQVYSTLGDHRPVPQVYSTLDNDQPVPQVYSTLGNHRPVPCRNNSNDTASPSL